MFLQKIAQQQVEDNYLEKAHQGRLNVGILYGRAGLLAKRVRGCARLALILLSLAVLGAGCASAPQVAPPEGVEKMPASEVLYRAALSTYETRTLPVEVASARFLIITSQYQPVRPDLRKRIVTQVVRAAPGAMNLTVTTEWETRVNKGDEHAAEWVWQPVDTPILRERGNAEERAIIRDIEQRFHAWKPSD